MRNAHLLRLATAAASLLLVGAGCGAKVETNVNAGATGTMPAVNEPTDSAGTSLDMRIGGNVIIVGEQKPGKQISIELVQTDKPTIVVIREGSYQDGKVIGTSAQLTVGNNQPVNIALKRASVDGETLYAVAYVDNGNGSFDASDTPLRDGAGNGMYATIIISIDADTDPLLPRI